MLNVSINQVIAAMPLNRNGRNSQQKRFLISQTSDAGPRMGNLYDFCQTPGWQEAAFRVANTFFTTMHIIPPSNELENIGYGLIALAGQNPHYKEGWIRQVWYRNEDNRIILALEEAVIAAGMIAFTVRNLPNELRSKIH